MLTLARNSRGLSQRELAAAINKSQSLLSQLERGLYCDRPGLLELLAQELHYPPGFFTQTGKIIPPGLSIYHRKRKSLSKKAADIIEASLNIRYRHVQELLEHAELDSQFVPYLPIEDWEHPTHAARQLRRQWNIPSGPIGNMTDVLERAGILVLHHDFTTREFDAETMIARFGSPVVFVNPIFPGDRIRASLAHELGHIVMHSLINPDMEREANIFAREFLVPGDELYKQLAGPVTLETLAHLKPYWRASMALILEQARAINKVDQKRYLYLRKQFSAHNYNRREPPEIEVERETPTLVNELIELYLSEFGFSELDLAIEKLHLFHDEFVQLYGRGNGSLRLAYSSSRPTI